MKKILGLFVVLAVLIMGGIANAQTNTYVEKTPESENVISITQIKINGNTVEPDKIQTISFERGNNIELTISLVASGEMKNVDLKAFITGYEYSDVDEISASTGTFDLEKDVTYIKKLKLPISELVEEDQYKVRIMVSDRNAFTKIVNFGIKIDAPKYKINIIDIIAPNKITSGSSLLTTVRLDNRGNRDLENIKVVFSIPQLSLSTADYVEKIKSNNEASTNELYIRLPKCVEEGTYTAEIDVYYNKGRDKVSTTKQIYIKNACEQEETTQQIIIIQEPEEETQQTTQATAQEKITKSTIRTGLEITLIVLVGLLILIGIVIGVSRIRKDEE